MIRDIIPESILMRIPVMSVIHLSQRNQWQQRIALKIDLRSEVLALRKTLSHQEIQDYSQAICQQFIAQLPAMPTNIHLFLPIVKNHEVDLRGLLPVLWERGDRVYVPRVTQEQQLEHVRLMPETIIEENQWGIPEPALNHPPANKAEIQAIRMVLTPLLVCDQEGFRVGYGGGFYDQFFLNYPHVQKIGVGFFEPITKILDTYEGDIPLDQYISPMTITRFHP